MNINLQKPKQRFLDLQYVYTVQSSEDPTVTYVTVIENPYKVNESMDICTCPGFKYRKDCRHMKEARADLKAQHDANNE